MRQRLWNRTLNFGCTRSRFQRSSEDFFAKLSYLFPFISLSLPEWHAETRQQAARLVVVAGRGHDRHLEAAQLVDLVVVDLRENDLLAQAERVVAPSVEALRVDAAEVADAGQRDVQQTVEEVPHPAAAKRGLDANRLALAELECGDCLARLDQRRLPAGDRDHVTNHGGALHIL